MEIEIIDESQVRVSKGTDKKKIIETVNVDKIIGDTSKGDKTGGKAEIVACVPQEHIKLIGADKLLQCDRVTVLGLTDNCVLCKGVNNEIFVKCKNKWADYS